VLNDVSNAWDDKLMYKFFFKKKSDPLVKKSNPGFFESSAFPMKELPQIEVQEPGTLSKSPSEQTDLKDKDKMKKSESKQSKMGVEAGPSEVRLFLFCWPVPFSLGFSDEIL